MVMQNRIWSVGLLLIVSFFLGNVLAQETETKLSLDKGTIDNQFKFVIEKSSPYQDTRVVKEGWLYALKKHVLDSLNSLKSNINEGQKKLAASKTSLDSLTTELNNTIARLDELSKEKNSMRFLGILLSKTSYTSLMLIIICTLLLALVFIFMLFKRSNAITVESKNLLEETKIEYDKFRKRALEKEQEMSRKHLAELNKYKNM